MSMTLGMSEPYIDYELPLTEREKLVVSELHQKGAASYARLVSLLWPGRRTHETQNNLKHFLCMLRKALDPYEIEIVTDWGRGLVMYETSRATLDKFVA